MLKSFVVILIMVAIGQAQATETTTPATSAPVTTAPTAPLSWNQLLQKKYSLTEAQMTALSDSKIAEPQTAMVAQLAKSSGKTVEEILKMHTESKTGWGNLAKQLGVDPKELGQAVSEMKHERNAERRKMKDSARAEHREDKEKHEKKDHPERKDHPDKKDHGSKRDK